jgi:hypothetical protein
MQSALPTHRYKVEDEYSVQHGKASLVSMSDGFDTTWCVQQQLRHSFAQSCLILRGCENRDAEDLT